jgi:hypothetical protein
MPATIDQLRENVTVLQDDISYLEYRLEALAADTPEAESAERVLNVKWRLLEEQRRLLERAEDSAPREAAEARWQHHFDNDTQDLY